MKNLTLWANPLLSAVDLDVLPPVMTSLQIGYPNNYSSAIANIGNGRLGQLVQVTGAVYIAFNPSLPELDLDALSVVGGQLTIRNNGVLNSIGDTSLGSLTASGAITVSTNPLLMFCQPQSDAIKARLPAVSITYSGNGCSP